MKVMHTRQVRSDSFQHTTTLADLAEFVQKARTAGVAEDAVVELADDRPGRSYGLPIHIVATWVEEIVA